MTNTSKPIIHLTFADAPTAPGTVMGLAVQAAHAAGWPIDRIEALCDEMITAQTFSAVLAVVQQYFEVA